MGRSAPCQPNDTAPSNLPSTYTGLPLMPCATAETSRPCPLSSTRMTSPPGDAWRRMPSTSTPNVSTVVPVNTVRPYPVRPGRTSSRGNTGGGVANAAAAVCSRTAQTTANVVFKIG